MVSVVIPTYNREKVICDSIMSVMNQTYKELEIIIVDDASEDDTENVVKATGDERVKYFRLEKHGGACAARNYGIAHASGEYIAFHDSDDICHPDRIEKELEALKREEADVVFCAFQKNYGKCRIMPVMEEGFKSFQEILMGFYVSTQTILGKTEVFRNVRFDEDAQRFQDYDLIIRVAKKHSVYYVNKVLVELFYQEDSITASMNDYEKREAVFTFLLKKYPELAERYPEWKAGMLYRLIRPLVMQEKSAEAELKELLSLVSTKRNKTICALYKLHLLKPIYEINEHIRNRKYYPKGKA